MKGKILVLLLLAFANILHAQYEPKVLFIGNSYTQVNDLPKMVADIALSTAERITYRSNTPGYRRPTRTEPAAIISTKSGGMAMFPIRPTACRLHLCP